MQNPSPLEILSAELGAVAGRIERDAALKISAAISDLKRETAERELRYANLEKALLEKVEARLASVKDGKDGLNGSDGKSVSIEDVQPLFGDIAQKAAALIPVPKDGKDGRDGIDGVSIKEVDTELTEGGKVLLLKVGVGETMHVHEIPLPAAKDGENGKNGRDGIDGKDGLSITVEEVMSAITSEIEKRVAVIPVPKDGKDGAPGLNGKDGINGRDGKLPLVRSWEDKVHREGEVVTFEGGTYQASHDTGKQPTHADWICLAAAGKPGANGRSITIRGTYDPDARYSALDQVALNGASFTAKKDDPGQ